MKKIVFVIESLHLGGAEKSLVTLLQNLDYNKYEVDLITFHPDGFFKDQVPAEVNHRVLPFPKLSYTDRLKFAWAKKRQKGIHHSQLFWPLIKKYFRRQEKKYDIAIAYNQGFATYFVGEFIDAPVKYAWLNTDYRKAGYDIILDYPVYQNYRKIIAVSPEAEERFRNALEEVNLTLPLEVIKDISDPDIIRIKAEQPLKHPFNPQKINLVSVGRLVEAKGFDLAIEACKILVDKGYPVNWYIVGEGASRISLEKKITDRGLDDSCKLLGADTNPYTYMKACDIYVQTSLFEGLGLTIIEAACLNKPIVSTNFPTVYGILKDGETGLIAEMNAESIAGAVQKLIDQPQLRDHLTGKLIKQENLDKEETLSKIENLLTI